MYNDTCVKHMHYRRHNMMATVVVNAMPITLVLPPAHMLSPFTLIGARHVLLSALSAATVPKISSNILHEVEPPFPSPPPEAHSNVSV